MYRDVEEILTRELREVADHVRVPALPELPSAPPPARFAWQPLLVAAALALVALATVASLLRMDDGQSPQPAPQPTDVVTDDATEALPESVPTGPPTVPYLVDRAVHVGGDRFPGYDWVEGHRRGWVGVKPGFVWWVGTGGEPRQLGVAVEQPPGVSPNGEYVAYISTEGEMNGFETDPAGEGMGLPVEVPVQDEDGVSTRTVVTDDGWVIASGRGVGVLWRPFAGAEPLDLSATSPGQLVWQATNAGLVVVDGTGDARDPGSGRVYLADLTAEGELAPIEDLPNFGIADISGDWMAWVTADQVTGDVREYDEIRVRRLDGAGEAVLSPPDGWRFSNTPFTFEDNQFFVARVVDGRQQRMARCSPALVECVLLDTPSADQ